MNQILTAIISSSILLGCSYQVSEELTPLQQAQEMCPNGINSYSHDDWTNKTVITCLDGRKKPNE